MPNNTLIDHLIAQGEECVFISPHLDDAVLSCGGLMLLLAGKVPVRVINVFTSAHEGPYTLSARKYLAQTKSKDALRQFAARKKEDLNVLTSMGITVENLDLVDALFRRSKKSVLGSFIPEVDHMYPTYRFHMQSLARDEDSVEKLQKRLQHKVSADSIVFAPYGIGNHVDHQITRLACEGQFSKLILYADFPYSQRTGDFGRAVNGQQKYVIHPDKQKKDALIALYESQVNNLFPTGVIPEHSEFYYSQLL